MKLYAFLLITFSCCPLISKAQAIEEINRQDATHTIIQSTEASKNHKTLLAVVRAADMAETLSGKGPFTVFAPSDVAFHKLSPEKMAELLRPENKKELQSLLTTHIVAGKLSAARILQAMCRGKGKASFTTIHGEELTATMDGIDILLADTRGNVARITTADAPQCNGVIHVIDHVLMPADF